MKDCQLELLDHESAHVLKGPTVVMNLCDLLNGFLARHSDMKIKINWHENYEDIVDFEVIGK